MQSDGDLIRNVTSSLTRLNHQRTFSSVSDELIACLTTRCVNLVALTIGNDEHTYFHTANGLESDCDMIIIHK